MPTRDPDASVVPLFKNHAVKNDAKTAKAGRIIFDDLEICEIRFGGSRNVFVFPATAVSHWIEDPQSGEQVAVTYAERFAKQYRQFKEQDQQTKSGTPLTHVPFLTEARRAELRALNIYTCEALAAVDGQELKNLGQGGRDLKNRAQEFIEAAKANAPNMELALELEQLRAKNAVLEEDAKAIRDQLKADDQFEDMTLEQLRDYITSHTGHAPFGQLNRKALVGMAIAAQPKVA